MRDRNSRRVVITGLGVVAPNGIGKDAFWENLIAGKSAVDYITAFDASPYPCQVAEKLAISIRRTLCMRAELSTEVDSHSLLLQPRSLRSRTQDWISQARHRNES